MGTKGYTIDVDPNYLPVQGGITEVASGGMTNGAAAFCTATAPYAISGTTKDAYNYPNPPPGAFSNVAGTGFDIAGQGINGAAVAPVCGV